VASNQKNYYDILNIPPDCSEDDIKKAYRRVAMSIHPDKNQGKKSSIWEDVQEAYSVL
jgi:DnaJ-class molecular chaperone